MVLGKKVAIFDWSGAEIRLLEMGRKSPGLDQQVNLHSLINTFVIHSLDKDNSYTKVYIQNSCDFLPFSRGPISAPFPIENSHLFSQYHVCFSQ